VTSKAHDKSDAVPALDTASIDSLSPADTADVFDVSAHDVEAALIVQVVTIAMLLTRTVLITVSTPPGAILR
jgi:hypothetical protein